LEYCLACDSRLSGFEHDICNNCYYDMEQAGATDIEKEIEKYKKENR
jgi:hypothetical protein